MASREVMDPKVGPSKPGARGHNPSTTGNTNNHTSTWGADGLEGDRDSAGASGQELQG